MRPIDYTRRLEANSKFKKEMLQFLEQQQESFSNFQRTRQKIELGTPHRVKLSLMTDALGTQLESVQENIFMVHVQASATALVENSTMEHVQKDNILIKLLVSHRG